jgi:hypothetical protein
VAYCECPGRPIIHQDNSQAWYEWLVLDEQTSGVETIVFRKKTVFWHDRLRLLRSIPVLDRPRRVDDYFRLAV